MQTTLNKIELHSPCEDGWNMLLNHLNKTEADDEPLELRTIFESNGLDDTIWAFRAVEGSDKYIRLFAADCAEMVLPIYEKEHPNDDRARKAIQAARDYANGLISAEELADAASAASAASAARDAASTAASAAAWAAASTAASAAGYASDAASTAASTAAGDAAWALWATMAASRDKIKSLLLKYI